jgi:predicted phage terminase large subunit-like protein
MLKPIHDTILERLQDVMLHRLPDGKTNLAILIPPGHGKTLLCHTLVEYGLGFFPDSLFLYTGYSTDKCAEETRKIGDVLQKPWYREIFPGVQLTKTAAQHFITSAGGEVYGVGVDGSITGFRAGQKRPEFGGAIIVDDPTKAQDARSLATLLECRRWYTGTLLSRKNRDDTPIVLIMQRLNPDDLMGHILKTESDRWHVVKAQGLQEDGTALWEETKTAAEWLRLKRVDEFTFWSQGQQEPVMPGGNIIKREWWKYYGGTYNVDSLVFMTADTGIKDKDTSDPSSIGVWHATQGTLDLLDRIKGRWTFPDQTRLIHQLYKKYEQYGVSCLYIEDKATGDPIARHLSSLGVKCSLWRPKDYGFPEDKLGRVRMSTWYLEAGRVRLPDDRPDITEPFVDECAAFSGLPTDHDDDVDCLTMAISVWKWKGGGADVRAA